MSAAAGEPAGAAPWYEAAFEAGYLDVYPHRDLDSARREVAGLVASGLAASGGRVLDLACGYGRHTLALREQGLAAYGLDLSSDLLARARMLGADGGDGAPGPLAGRIVRGDVRALPFAGGAFAAVVMLFSSWGYFDDDANRGVLEEIARVLRPGGELVLDLMNADRIRRTLVPESRDERDGRVLLQRRHLAAAGYRVVKEVTLYEPDGSERSWREDVRLVGPHELEVLLSAHGLELETLAGDFDGREFDADAPRMIARARRRGARA